MWDKWVRIDKIGKVTIWQVDKHWFKGTYHDKHTRRVNLVASTIKEAKKQAGRVDRELLVGSGYYVDEQDAPSHTIKDALLEWARSRRVRRQTHKDDTYRSNRFIKWMHKRYHGVKWGDLKPHHIQEYVHGLEDDRLAYNTIRLRFAPIRAASIYLSNNYDHYRDVARTVRLPEQEFKRPEPVAGETEIRALFAYVKQERPDLIPIVALQVLARLRVLEALARSPALAPTALVVVQHDSRTPAPASAGPLEATDTRSYGGTTLTFLERPASEG